MDDIMSRLGLSGRAFLPLLLGFGCTVPAVMASRALEHKRDRFKTILVTPFMSCSARLPIYVLFSSMFFGKYAMLVCYSMYLLGILIAIGIAYILSKIDGSKAEHALMIELPEYKSPNARTIAIYVWQKIKDYLTKAGTVIFIASVIMWGILNGYLPEFRLPCRKSNRSSFRACRPWLLADHRGADRRNCSKRGCGIQLQRTIRHSEHHHRPRHECHGGHFRFHRLRRCQRLCLDGFLPALCSLHCYDRHHTQRTKELEIHIWHHALPAGGRMDNEYHRLPYRALILNQDHSN